MSSPKLLHLHENTSIISSKTTVTDVHSRTLLNNIIKSAGFKRERKCDELSEKVTAHSSNGKHR